MEYNLDELSAPAWLSDAFFEHVIREFEGDQAAQLAGKCELRPGTKAGDHFASVMFRTTVRYRSNGDTRSLDLILKIKPEADGFKKDLLEEDDFFGKEIRMYREMLPAIARLLASIGEEFKFPRLIHAATQPRTVIILEDLSSQGWEKGGLIKSFEEMQPTIANIAKFHAASAVLAHNDPQMCSQYRCTIADTLSSMRGMNDGCFASFVKFLRETLELPELVGPVENFHRQLDDRLRAAYATSTNCANVLIHGDFTFKNILHQHAAGKVVDTIFVDYQLSSWSSQTVDLFYLTYLIPEQSIKDAHRDEIIYSYYKSFRSVLERLNFGGRIPTLNDVQTELIRNGSLELYHYIVFSAFRYIDLSLVDPEAFFLGRIDNPALQMEEYRRTIRKELKRFMYQGIVED